MGLPINSGTNMDFSVVIIMDGKKPSVNIENIITIFEKPIRTNGKVGKIGGIECSIVPIISARASINPERAIFLVLSFISSSGNNRVGIIAFYSYCNFIGCTNNTLTDYIYFS